MTPSPLGLGAIPPQRIVFSGVGKTRAEVMMPLSRTVTVGPGTAVEELFDIVPKNTYITITADHGRI